MTACQIKLSARIWLLTQRQADNKAISTTNNGPSYFIHLLYRELFPFVFIIFIMSWLSLKRDTEKNIDVVVDVLHSGSDCHVTWLTSYILSREWHQVMTVTYCVFIFPYPEWCMTRRRHTSRLLNKPYIRVNVTSAYCSSQIDISQTTAILCSRGLLFSQFFSCVIREPFKRRNFAGFHEPVEATSVLSFFFLVLFISLRENEKWLSGRTFLKVKHSRRAKEGI